VRSRNEIPVGNRRRTGCMFTEIVNGPLGDDILFALFYSHVIDLQCCSTDIRTGCGLDRTRLNPMSAGKLKLNFMSFCCTLHEIFSFSFSIFFTHISRSSTEHSLYSYYLSDYHSESII